jgi:hypothetical protein
MLRRQAILAVASALLAAGGCAAPDDERAAAGRESGSVQAGSTTAASEAAGQSSLVAAQTQSFDRFWTAFRQAVIAGDKNRIVSMTYFPFETRGTSDDDPVRTHDRASFLGILDRLLADDAGMQATPEPMRRYVERMTTLTDRNHEPGATEAGVGNFRFRLVGGRWLFTRAYMDD